MKELILKAYAKINLSIDVLGKLPSGYHEVLMVMEQVDLYDTVKIIWQEGLEAGSIKGNPKDASGDAEGVAGRLDDDVAINLSTSLSYLPDDQGNIAYRAAERMIREYGKGRIGTFQIHIDKRIPVAAGLAGGSANCAAVLHGVNQLWNLGLDLKTLMRHGTALGADVPFCLAGQAALNKNLYLHKDPLAGTCAAASGIGEKLEQISPMKAWVLLSKPSISISTAQVYGGLNLEEIENRPNTVELKAGLREGNYYKISKNMTNVLENYSLKEYPVIVYTKNKMEQEGNAYKVLMSGSGPTVFGLYTSKRKGEAAYSKLRQLNQETFFVKAL
ncbi:4-(cytidine 5'-diphospho)-2-C-methyl-D-erythritol kinase [Anoxybacterium hadale]|uniref:4-(Cytidine 5'-diphospho)-2-C-methyl-D-erythritol kinase n=1 Tax=Anoxybacterium hadale TaxID=3408580 RepID=A0ACD1AEZ5_9FIRM|nr:4-(cytidine 5'-diphospho)-2-C-methyl-D-erythritol kinase [Clostridiales bacterium]